MARPPAAQLVINLHEDVPLCRQLGNLCKHGRVVHDGSNGRITFRSAETHDLVHVLSVLDEAAAWLRGRGIRQWPARLEACRIEDAARLG